MPIAFGSILGGLTTLIGTPPNIIIAAIRQEALGLGFSMFDFTPVGIVVASVGVLYIVLLGWRLIPKNRIGQKSMGMFQVKDYITEVVVPEDSPFIGKMIAELEPMTAAEFLFLGFIRANRKRLKFSDQTTLLANDILIIEAKSVELEKFVQAGKLGLVGSKDISTGDLKFG